MEEDPILTNLKILIIFVLQLIYIKENGEGTKMIPEMREIPLKQQGLC